MFRFVVLSLDEWCVYSNDQECSYVSLCAQRLAFGRIGILPLLGSQKSTGVAGIICGCGSISGLLVAWYGRLVMLELQVFC